MERGFTVFPCSAGSAPASGARPAAPFIRLIGRPIRPPRQTRPVNRAGDGDVTAAPPIDVDRLKALLRQGGIGFAEEPSGRLAISGGPDDYLIEVDATGGVWCLFGVDMQELRLLVSGSSNEDLGEDELQRVAREQLRPLYRRYQPLFVQAGFEEEVIVDAESYAIACVKRMAGANPAEIVEAVRWCCRAGQPARGSGVAP